MGKLYTKLSNIFFRDSRKELLLYLCLWLLMFLAPLLAMYIRQSHSGAATAFPWAELKLLWWQYAIFLLMFLVHNYILAPLLVHRQRRALYFSSLTAMLGVFLLLQCSIRPHHHFGDPHEHERHMVFDEHPPHADASPRDRPALPGLHGHHEGERPNGTLTPGANHHPPVIIGEHDVVATIIFILMLGMNIGVKLYFRQQKDRDRMMKLEHDNLEQQLEYLKYQINPHFLMNTLNNIHALVDIDPEQAKETIVELSKIMRFVLYEGSKQKVPLRLELLFLENYVKLMQMRFTDQVTINVDLPDIIPDRDLPPLLLITFVENAFKHGVSYQKQSFINISISVSTPGRNHQGMTLVFQCVNSKKPHAEDSHGGVGLQNARRRLDLLYGSDYTLAITDDEATYTVDLEIPI